METQPQPGDGTGEKLQQEQELSNLLEGMNVPPTRISVEALKQTSNLRWLGRNLALQNGEHAHLARCVELLKKLEPKMLILQ